jgi:hypothetical protein
MGDDARIIADIERGDRVAAGQLLPLIYDELHRLAAGRLAPEAPGRRSRQQPWSTRPTCGSSAAIPTDPSTAAATASPPPRPCAAS